MQTKPSIEAKQPAPIELALLTSVFVLAACGLLYVTACMQNIGAEPMEVSVVVQTIERSALARIFHHDGVQRAQQRDGWACGMPRQGLPAPARQAVRPDTRCWDAMNTECFCRVHIGFDKNEALSEV